MTVNNSATGAGILLESDTNELEVVEFRVDEVGADGQITKCYYGTNVAKVREIIRVPQIWKGLQSDPRVAGMIKLRGNVIAVMNLAMILNKNTDGLSADKIIVLEFNGVVIGVLVHEVNRIHRLSWTAIEPPPPAVAADNITGVVKFEDRMILLLDFERITGELCPEAAMKTVYAEDLSGVDVSMRAKHTVLIADDSSFIRGTMVNTLRTAGYNIVECEDGQKAWDVISSGVHNLSLVVTDIEMPRMDGLHLTSKIRKESKIGNVPIVIFSSLASDDNKIKWKDLGASHILTKPELPMLAKVVDGLCLGAVQL